MTLNDLQFNQQVRDLVKLGNEHRLYAAAAWLRNAWFQKTGHDPLIYPPPKP